MIAPIPATPAAAGTGRTDAAAASAPSGKLRKAAEEFEAIVLATLLEKMQKTFAGVGESQDPAHDTLGSLGTEALAQGLAANGGVGLARMILHQMSRSPGGGGSNSPDKT